jgi:probable phosphoglycerate mutase
VKQKRVVLVWHGQSTWNAEGRIQGSSDISVLTPKGEYQAETSRQMLLSDSRQILLHRQERRNRQQQ